MKEEITVVKLKSILTLLESVEVEDIELFGMHYSHIVTETVIMLSDLLKEKLISNINKYKLAKDPWRLTAKQKWRPKVAKWKKRNLKNEGSFY